MDLDEIKRGLRAEIKKRENEQYFTCQLNVRQMCKDVLAKLEEQEVEIAEKDAELRRQKYKRCLEMANNSCEYCEGEKPVHENLVCFLAGSIRFIHIVKHKFGHYLSISTWGKFGKNQKFIKIQYCPMCGRNLKEADDGND